MPAILTILASVAGIGASASCGVTDCGEIILENYGQHELGKSG
jgi:hypothetical protein